MKKILLFGYGNPDRGDDGAAFHILSQLFHYYDVENPDIFSAEIIKLNQDADVLFNFQLLPEYADVITDYEKVIFIDAHTAEIDEELNIKKIEPNYQYSPFTHHFSPASCLALVKSLNKKAPKSWLLSIRGYQFGFSRQLSNETSILVEKAVQYLLQEFLQ